MDNGEQQLSLSDSKFRHYSNLMERALKSFENTREWADLISALSKVNKVVAANKSYNILPKKVTIGKRLAQCLHPALPAGVHIKALELYETIFTTIGPAFIAKDFPIYSAGLLPLLGHAAMTVKPALLKLYETFIIPVCSSIRPAAAGVILGVLPGLEEGSEYYDRTNSLLERLSKEFGVEHFYSNFWSCLNCSSNVRLAGTGFLLSHVDRSRSMEDQLYLLGSDLGLLVSALKACLEDTAVLVQRNTLDILSIAFPFHDSQLTKSDQSEVIGSALLVLLRRDMSLNRRLYAWLLGVTTAGTSVVKRAVSPEAGRHRHDSGSSSASEPELEYFTSHSKRLLVQSLQSHLDSVSDEFVDIIKPLRIVTSLLDRADIGSVVLEGILINVFRLLRRFHSTHTDKQFADNSQMSTYRLAESLKIDLHTLSVYHTSTYDLPIKPRTELLKACNLLFGSLEPNFIWEFLSDTYERVLWPSEVRPGTDLIMAEYCDIVNMLLSILSLETYVETQTVHLPRLLYNLLNMLKENIAVTSLSDVAQVLLLCRRLTAVISPADVTATDEVGAEMVTLHESIPLVQDILCLGILQSKASSLQDTDLTSRRHSLLSCCLLLIEMSSFPVYSTEEMTDNGANHASSGAGGATDIPNWIKLLLLNSSSSAADIECQFICAAVLIDLIKLSHLSVETNQRSRPLHRHCSLDSESSLPLVNVNIRPLISELLISSISFNLEAMFTHIWSNIDVEKLLYSTECSVLMSSLLSIHSECKVSSKGDIDDLQNVIIKDLTHKDHVRRLEAYKKFSLFWHQTRHIHNSSGQIRHVLMVVLSSLMYETELVQEVIRDWLIHAVECDDLNRILEPYLILLLESDTSRTSVQQRVEAKQKDTEEPGSKTSSNQNTKVHKTASTKVSGSSKPLSPRAHSRVTRDGRIAPAHLHRDSVSSESSTQCNGAMTMNPFGTVSALDSLIFDGFTPHESLKSRWASISNGHMESKPLEVNSDDKQEAPLQKVSNGHQADEPSTNPFLSQSDNDGQASETAATSSSIIPMPERGQPYRTKEEPPPLSDDNAQQVAEELVGDILTSAMDGSTLRRGGPPEEITQVTSNGATGARNGLQVVEVGTVLSSVTSPGSVSSNDSNGTDQQDDLTADEGDRLSRLHGFVLLYDQCYDTERVLFALSVIQKVIAVSPSLVLSNLTTSPCSDTQLLNLLARHRRSLEGDNYYTELNAEEVISLKNTRLLEILVTVCLYLWRSYHVQNHDTHGCVTRNSHVQLRAINLLMTLLTDVTHILADSPKGFPHYMVDVLSRCKVVKTCIFHLQCLLENRESKLSAVGASHDASVDIQMFRKCLQLSECLIRLESKLLLVHEHQNSSVKGGAPVLFKRMMFSHPSLLSSLNAHLSQAKYAAVHHQWVSLITNSLPHVLSQSVTADVVQSVIVRMCEIFDRVSGEESTTLSRYPPDYIQQLLEGFTVICHFCFMDLNSNLIGQSEENKPTGISTSQILSNLISVFNPLSSAIKSKLGSSEQDSTGVVDGDLRLKCRDRLLSMMPKILSSVSTLWRAAKLADNQKVVQLVIGFFSPILHNYTEQLLGSVAVVWSDSQDSTIGTTPLSTQSTLVELLLCIKALPMDTIVDKLSVVMKRPPSTNHQTNSRVLLQLSCLKFLRGYIIKTPSIAKSSLSSVCSLLKHCLQLGLPAPGVLLLLETVTEFVYKLGVIDDRKVVKDLQEIVSKVVEACCQIISAQLEASSWTIRKNYTVKVRAQSAETSDPYNVSSDPMSNSAPGITVEDNVSTEEHESEYTSHALALLAEVTAGLLDVVYPSEDKDKVATLLTNVLARIFPYLRNHNLLNMTCFQASSKLLASISSYQYTRRTWKRDVYDILLSSEFFKMDVQSLQFWKILADNLVTHEKTMFKDLLAKFAITANTIQLFHNKEYEHMQSVHNLKKLTFIIYSADVDHYKHYMPDIQERLAENLRMTQVPAVLSQGFLCFRVLLLRMSSGALTSLWPTIVTELVYVMTQIEQDLALSDEEEQQMSRVTEIDSFSSLNEVSIHHSTSWLQLYLSACKLLDLLMFLPPDLIPEFQNYIWMFTGSDDMTVSKPAANQQESGERLRTGFSSHIPKISQMMEWKFGPYNSSSKRRASLLLQEQTISTLNDLHPFFARLMIAPVHSSQQRLSVIEQAESVIDNDFIEPVT